jgi:succinyl-diaminopimelate desuccinylase
MQYAMMTELLNDLINIQSITPEDKGAQDLLEKVLSDLGFCCQRLNKNRVSNLYARLGSQSPTVLFAGHTDVVSPGPLGNWHSPPFELNDSNDKLVGRGVADMKGAIVAMIGAVGKLIEQDFNGSIAFLITSGEEGDDFLDGTPHAMNELLEQGEHFDYCIVGEPSSHKQVGDTIKVGRRGSMTCKVCVKGLQGHVAYPHLADNPIHKAAPIINALSELELDEGNDFFPPSSLQITNVNAGVGQGNVIPKDLEFEFNIRYSTEQTFESLCERIRAICDSQKESIELKFTHNGPPFLTSSGKLIEQSVNVIKKHLGYLPKLSTDGGTSDGRFIAPLGIELIEFGLINESIHKANEWIYKDDLSILSELYFDLLEGLYRE